MTTKITAYQCDFCKDPRLFLSRSGANKHEKSCWLNPIRRSCATCGNLYSDYQIVDANWECLVTSKTPFKQKIDNCPHYDKGCGIFNDGQND